MKRLISFALLIPILLGLMISPSTLVQAQQPGPQEKIDLIIQTSGSAKVLARQVRSLGGEVHIVYRNISAIAASIPLGKFNQLAKLPGVTSVQKDLRVRLPEDRPVTTLNGQMARQSKIPIKTNAVVRSDPVGLSSSKSQIQPLGYANFMYTGADQIWDETNQGEGSIVAVVSSGVYPNSCLQHALIGSPGYPDGFNATEDGVPATDINNDGWGTYVAGAIAGSCHLEYPDPSDLFYQALSAYLPWGPDFVPLWGQAPQAKIYPIKVITPDWYTSSSIVLYGLDHVLSLKRDGLLDIDIVNISLGFVSLYEGRDVFEDMVSLLNEAGILVVSAADNYGSTPNNITTPASTSASLAVGGLDYAISSRIVAEWFGLYYGPNNIELDGDEGPGMGMVMRPSDETRLDWDSSRGPLSNGYMAPDISAHAMYNLLLNQYDQPFPVQGNSYAAATVAGVAALLNTYLEEELDQQDAVLSLRNALLKGANREAIGESWRGVNDTGFGAVDAVGALQLLKSGDLDLKYPVYVGKLKANILGTPRRNHTETYLSEAITLQPGEMRDFIFPISRATSKVTMEITDMDIPDPSDYSYEVNYLQLQVQSAKRGGMYPGIWWWIGPDHGEKFNVEIFDGPWLIDGMEVNYWPMESGLMKVTLSSLFFNESPVSFKLSVIRENYRPLLRGKVAEGEITWGQEIAIPVTIPEGVSKATFDLVFNRDWSKFPTSDIDMYILDPEMNLVSVDGAYTNAPERAVIYDPVPGEWLVLVHGYELYKPDHYTLYLNTE